MQQTHRTDEELIGELVDLCQKVSEIGATLLVRDRAADGADGESKLSKVADLPWWAERALRLKELDPGDLSELSVDDVKRLIRKIQSNQVEIMMQNERLARLHDDLKKSRDRYSQLFDFAPVGYFTLSDELLILEANKTGARLLGRPADQLIGTPFSAFICKSDYPIYYGHLRRTFSTKTRQTCELQLEPVRGNRFPARFESTIFKDAIDGSVRCQTVVSNIVDLRRAEEALRESEELHRITLTNISDTVLISNDRQEFTYVCPNVHVIFGYTNEEVMSMGTVGELLGARLYDAERLKAEGELHNIERRITDKNNNEHVLLVNVKQVSIKGGTTLISCRDITDLRSAERALSGPGEDRQARESG